MTSMARPRRGKNQGLSPNLYVNNRGYFLYRNPVTGQRHGMGKDKAKAQAAARMLNARLMPGADLVARVMGTDDLTFEAATKAWLAERVDNHPRLSDWTKRGKHSRAGRLMRDAGSMLLEHLDTRWCAEYLDSNYSGDPYTQYRSVLSQIFDFAITKGWAKLNPVAPTRKSDESYEKQRRRLTVEQFQQIHALAEPWFQIAMELSLLCLFGRAEAAAAKYDAIHDDALHYIRQKTRTRSKTAYVAISMTPAIEDLVKRSRGIMPLSPFIVHRNPKWRRSRLNGQAGTSNKEHWTAVAPDMLSREFQRLREKVPSIKLMAAAQQPTYHEIRSLGARLLELKGVKVDSIQVLMGHADEEMTQHYLDGYGTRWQHAEGNSFTMSDLLSENHR
ncbi:hypothetical protein R84981_000944 [Carnimonas sp. R-84981]|uniref:phage integrase Arm DNA-binding domain-containing protein n=1 Tax=Carnimonas bestiolae TaxID=3402172 RepID=UPI003EDC7F8D